MSDANLGGCVKLFVCSSSEFLQKTPVGLYFPVSRIYLYWTYSEYRCSTSISNSHSPQLIWGDSALKICSLRTSISVVPGDYTFFEIRQLCTSWHPACHLCIYCFPTIYLPVEHVTYIRTADISICIYVQITIGRQCIYYIQQIVDRGVLPAAKNTKKLYY